MTPGKLRAATVLARATQVQAMLDGISALPQGSLDEFVSDPRTVAAAESYLRRALEGLLDLARHLLAKGFGRAPAEYKQLATELLRLGVLDHDHADTMTELACYRNRMVHFYDEISDRELYAICTEQVTDVSSLLQALLTWVRLHPEKLDGSL